MAEYMGQLRNVKDEANEAVDRVKSEVQDFVEFVDVRRSIGKIEQYGKENPLALAVASLAVGLAAGAFMRMRMGRD